MDSIHYSRQENNRHQLQGPVTTLNVPAANAYLGQESVMAYMIVLVMMMKKIAISEFVTPFSSHLQYAQEEHAQKLSLNS